MVLSYENALDIFNGMKAIPIINYMAQVNEKTVGSFALLIMDNLGHLGAPSGMVEDVEKN